MKVRVRISTKVEKMLISNKNLVDNNNQTFHKKKTLSYCINCMNLLLYIFCIIVLITHLKVEENETFLVIASVLYLYMIGC